NEGWKLYKCQKPKMNPFSGVKEISEFWKDINNVSKGFWKVPNGLFWICGKKAHTVLPSGWKGCCTLGIIQHRFFLLHLENGEELGVPV
ncbi:ENR1 protein, partial [Scytalopus superciliaris]|nr:ENR1 protein [Scytalopus superciliaris]